MNEGFNYTCNVYSSWMIHYSYKKKKRKKSVVSKRPSGEEKGLTCSGSWHVLCFGFATAPLYFWTSLLPFLPEKIVPVIACIGSGQPLTSKGLHKRKTKCPRLSTCRFVRWIGVSGYRLGSLNCWVIFFFLRTKSFRRGATCNCTSFLWHVENIALLSPLLKQCSRTFHKLHQTSC